MPANNRLLIAGLIIVAIIAVAAAAYFYTKAQQAPPAQAEKTKIVIWYPDELGIKPKYVDKAAQELRKKYPDIEVEVKRFKMPPGQFFDKLVLALASGEGPDVIHVPGDRIPQLASAGFIVPLDDYVNNWPDWNNFFESVREATKYKGHVYSVPMALDTRFMFYRKDHFRAAGLPVPWSPKNWDDIVAAAKTLKSKGVTEYPLVIYAGRQGKGATSDTGFMMLLCGAGGKIYDPEEGKWIVKSQAILDVLRFYKRIYVDEKLVDPQILTTPKPWTAMRNRFIEGGISILVEGAWVPGGWIKSKGKEYVYKVMGYTPMPGERGGYAAVGGLGMVWAVTSQSKHPEIAFEFIKIISKLDYNVHFNLEDPHPSPRKDAVNHPDYQANKYLVDATKTLQWACFLPNDPDWGKVKEAINTMTEWVVTGEKSPEQAMNDFADLMKYIVGPDKIKTLPVKG